MEEILKDDGNHAGRISSSRKKSKSSVQSKPYYSDDDEDDDEDIADEAESTTEEDDDAIESPKAQASPQEEADKSKQAVDNMTLIDLASLNQSQQQQPHYQKLAATPNSSSSSSSSHSSPSPPRPQAKQTQKYLSHQSSKLAATAIIFNHLIDEENRQKPPANPFPVKQLNSKIAKNGLRLGLYK